jgi:hypothetical protein
VPSLSSVFSSSGKELTEDEEQLLLAREQEYLYAHTKVLL